MSKLSVKGTWRHNSTKMGSEETGPAACLLFSCSGAQTVPWEWALDHSLGDPRLTQPAWGWHGIYEMNKPCPLLYGQV
jgi:hypothetical protein